MSFVSSFLKKLSPASKQVKFKKANGISSRIIVQKDPKKSTMLMRGLIGLVLISTSASLYNKDKIYNQLGLENGTKYNLNVIDLDKKNFKYRNYFANTTDIFKKSKSPDMIFFNKLNPLEQVLTIKYFSIIYPKLNRLPPELNLNNFSMEYFSKLEPLSHANDDVSNSLSLTTKFHMPSFELLEMKAELDKEFDDIVDGLNLLLEKKYTKDFCKRIIREIFIENKLEHQMPLYYFSSAPRVFVVRFEGDTMCTQLQALREQVDFLLENCSSKNDVVLIHLDSPGGTVSSYGQAAFQLKRLRDAGIRIEVSVDQVAASGGYLMSCVADKIYAPSFAMVGSIGVYMSSINFSERLNREGIYEKNFVAGENKKNYSPFGPVTPDNEKKLIKDVEAIHNLFKTFVGSYRPNIDLKKTADGSVFMGDEALTLGLIDEIKSYEEVLSTYTKNGYRLFNIKAVEKKNFNNSPFFANVSNFFSAFQSKYSNVMALSTEHVSPLEILKLMFFQ